MIKPPIKYRLLLVLLFWASIHAQQYTSLDQRVDIQASGTAEILVQVKLTNTDSLPSLKLACSFNAINDISATLQPLGSELPVFHMIEHSVPYIVIDQVIPPGDHVIAIAVRVDDFLDWDAAGPEEFGTYEWEVSYENNQPVAIDSSRLTIKLPEGWNFHRVLSSAPEFKKKDPKPPYTFSKVDGQASVAISSIPLKYRGKLAMEFSFKKEKKGTILIYVGLIIALLYLYYFKDLILKHRSEDGEGSDEPGN